MDSRELSTAALIVSALSMSLILFLRLRSRKPKAKFFGVTFSGPLPNSNSILEVVRWVFLCFSQQYSKRQVKRALEKTSVVFVDSSSVLFADSGKGQVAFVADARKSELAALLSERVVQRLEPKLPRAEVCAKIAKAWVAFPKDYYTPR